MCDCGIRGDRHLARPCHSAVSAACWRSKSRATEAVEQCFYRSTPAVFQTLCERFSQTRRALPGRRGAGAILPTEAKTAKASRHVIDGRAMPHGNHRAAPVTRRCTEGARWTRSARPVSRDARHATCGMSMRRSMRACSSDCLRVTPAHAHRVVCRCHARAMCRYACRSRIDRARARVCREKFRARCGIHASFFSSRASALSDVDARVDVDARYRTPSTRAVHRSVHLCGCKPA